MKPCSTCLKPISPWNFRNSKIGLQIPNPSLHTFIVWQITFKSEKSAIRRSRTDYLKRLTGFFLKFFQTTCDAKKMLILAKAFDICNNRTNICYYTIFPVFRSLCSGSIKRKRGGTKHSGNILIYKCNGLF